MSEESSTHRKEKLCGLCDQKESRYCCPRCEVLYCSLDCYKSDKHGNCSESFYRECVTEELASYQNDDDSRQKMIDILKRIREEDLASGEQIDELLENIEDIEEVDSDDEEIRDAYERFKDINLDDADTLWNALTEDERNDFEAILNQGDVGSILPQWEPWWNYNNQEKKIQDVNTMNQEEEEAIKKCPALMKVPTFSVLTKIKPSPAIRYNITNVIAAYSFVMRYFNGEVDPVEGSICLLNICANLDSNMNFDHINTAMESVAQKCLQSEFIKTDETSLHVMKHDAFLILEGPNDKNKTYYARAALSDTHRMLSEAKTALKGAKNVKEDGSGDKKTEESKGTFSKKFPDHKLEHLPKLDMSKVKKCIKKVEYYLSFIEYEMYV